jgi:hypothetical protein
VPQPQFFVLFDEALDIPGLKLPYPLAELRLIEGEEFRREEPAFAGSRTTAARPRGHAQARPMS